MQKLSRENSGGIAVDFKKNSVGFTYAIDPTDSEVLAGASSKALAFSKAKKILNKKYPKRSKK